MGVCGWLITIQTSFPHLSSFLSRLPFLYPLTLSTPILSHPNSSLPLYPSHPAFHFSHQNSVSSFLLVFTVLFMKPLPSFLLYLKKWLPPPLLSPLNSMVTLLFIPVKTFHDMALKKPDSGLFDTTEHAHTHIYALIKNTHTHSRIYQSPGLVSIISSLYTMGSKKNQLQATTSCTIITSLLAVCVYAHVPIFQNGHTFV